MTAERLREELDEMYREMVTKEQSEYTLGYKNAIIDISIMVDKVVSYEEKAKKLIVRKSNEMYQKAMQATSRSEYEEYMAMSVATGAMLVCFKDDGDD